MTINSKPSQFKYDEINIRQEKPTDREQVFDVIQAAFKDIEESDQSEGYLVDRLRGSSSFIPELSLVAETDDRIVAHILVSKVEIVSDNKVFSVLSLAPVSVLPAYQSCGIGSRLINKAHEIACSLGFTSIVLIGHKEYYPRFGYQPASMFDIAFPFDIPDPYCMACELKPNALDGIHGMVRYPPEFNNG